MENSRDPFTTVIQEAGFRPDRHDNLRYLMYDGTWKYIVYAEGYAYVIYKEINLYVRPVRWILSIYNVFKKTRAEIKLTYEVPIAHFRDADRFKECVSILTDKLEDGKEEVF